MLRILVMLTVLILSTCAIARAEAASRPRRPVTMKAKRWAATNPEFCSPTFV